MSTRTNEACPVQHDVATVRLLLLPSDAIGFVVRHLDARSLACLASTCAGLFYGRWNPVVETLRLRGAVLGRTRLPRLVLSWAVYLAWIECRRVEAWRPIAAADGFSVVADDVRLVCVGRTPSAAGTATSTPVPTVHAIPTPRIHFVCIAAGRGFIAAVCSVGDVYTWGKGHRMGCLGHGDRIDELLVPMHLQALGAFRIRSVSASQHCLAVAESGELFSWGSALDGVCGHGWSWRSAINHPRKVDALAAHTVRAASAGCGHSLVLSEDGVVFSFGRGDDGQLGHGNTDDIHTPTPVGALRSVHVTAVAAGSVNSLALAAGGSVFAWGSDGPNETAMPNPRVIDALNGRRVCSIETSFGKRCAITSTGELFCWDSAHGRDPSDQPVPTRNETFRGEQIVKASLGRAHNVAVTADGRVFQWGEDARVAPSCRYVDVRCLPPCPHQLSNIEL